MLSSSKACFSIFHASVYIFTVATLTPDKVVVFERHKITESLVIAVFSENTLFIYKLRQLACFRIEILT